MNKPLPTAPLRARVVWQIWNNLPRLVLLAMIVVAVSLFNMVKERQATITADKAAQISPDRPPVNTVTMTVQPRPISDRLNLPGVVEPWTWLKLLAKVAGTITEVPVQSGDRVKPGDILARIEDADYRIAVQRAEAAYRLAETEFSRDEALYAKGGIPVATLDSNRARLQTAKADYDQARLQFSRTKIVAPMEGIIHELPAKVGLQLSVGDPVAEILETDRLKGVVGIPESDVDAVRHLEEVSITIQALADRQLTAAIHFLAPAPQSMARLYNLELAIDNPGGEILPGMFLRADIVKSRRSDALSVPLYSVISRNDAQYLYVDEAGIARRRDIRLGVMEGWLVEVVEGLQAGDRVLIEGHRDVEDGQPIKVIRNLDGPEEMRR